jgi:hypothetical protein
MSSLRARASLARDAFASDSRQGRRSAFVKSVLKSCRVMSGFTDAHSVRIQAHFGRLEPP